MNTGYAARRAKSWTNALPVPMYRHLQDNHAHVKLLLALLALLTGFSVTDGVRIANPAMAQGNGVVRDSQLASEDRQAAVSAAIYLVAAALPLVLALVASQRWSHRPAVGQALATVQRSDRLRQ